MMIEHVLFSESRLERHTADAVREELQRSLDTGELPRDEAAALLGLVPVGLDALMARYWSFEEAFRVSLVTGIDFGGKLSELERRET